MVLRIFFPSCLCRKSRSLPCACTPAAWRESTMTISLTVSVGQQMRKQEVSQTIILKCFLTVSSCYVFVSECSLPDTLNSWFLVAQLHVWWVKHFLFYSNVSWSTSNSCKFFFFFSTVRMCLVRMRQEGRAGKYMCRYIVHSMWEDVEQRSKIMGVSSVWHHSETDGSWKMDHEHLDNDSFQAWTAFPNNGAFYGLRGNNRGCSGWVHGSARGDRSPVFCLSNSCLINGS